MATRWGWRSAALGISLVASLPAAGAAQPRLVDARDAAAAPTIQYWSFPDDLVSDTLRVTSALQFSVPVTVSFSPVRDWRVDLSTAHTRGSVSLATAVGGAAGSLSVDGFTDSRIRANGRLFDERLWITLGVNLPTGRVRLSDDEVAAIRILAAPALRLATPSLGRGSGAIAGAVYTTRLGPWAAGLGASYELRGAYTALDASLAGGGTALAELEPGGALRFSAAFDRIAGHGRLVLLLTADRFASDIVVLRGPGDEAPVRTEYRLGPVFTAHAEYRTVRGRARDLRVWATQRYRTQFSEPGVGKVAGSDGGMLDFGASAVLGRAGAVGLIAGGRGAFDTGLALDNTVATAGVVSAVLEAGLDFPLRGSALRATGHTGVARVDTGAQVVSARTLGFSVALRTEW